MTSLDKDIPSKPAQELDDAAEARASDEVSMPPITFADIWQAQQFLKPLIEHTPMVHSTALSTLTEADIYLKFEQMQRGGSFKVRGATYKLSRLSEEQRRAGVITASAGNHAQGVAIAAAYYNVPCTIVVPENAPLTKVTATQSYGANVVLWGATYDDAVQHSFKLQQELGGNLYPGLR